MIDFVHTLFLSSDPLPLLEWTLYFFLIYISTASLISGLGFLVNRRIDVRLDDRVQLIREVLQSMRSILLFGSGMLVPWGLLHLGLANIDTTSDFSRISLEIIVLILWNDLYFYFMHRLLHARFKKWHLPHHKSIVTTPYSSYSMSVTEALLLGSVLPLAMLLHDFSMVPLFVLPIWSILINALAHSNCDLFPNAKEGTLLGFIRHHQAHHSYYQGNYSFFFHRLDDWFGTDRTSMQKHSNNKGSA